ncbi:MAG: VWA domain-containing protein [Acidobacteriota bacterium]|nr:VWA domain-containing protein [Acidobacteriota bacterium]
MTTSDVSIMPGGGIARRPLHLIIVADCSGSMAGEKMQALNFAIANMLPHLADWERDQERARILVRVLTFATAPAWHIEEPVPVADLRWMPLTVVPKGRTNLAPALRLIAEVLSPERIERRALRPAVVLITDGLPTDREDDLDAAFGAIESAPGARAATRVAVAIGRDARSEALVRFIGDPTVPVLVADNTDEIADRLVAASIAVSRLSEAGSDRKALVDSLFHPSLPSDPFERETII